MSAQTLYSLDTSWLINLQVNYPIDIFPPVWERLESLFTAQRAYIIDLVFEELEEKDDEVYRWIKARGEGIIKKLTDAELLTAQSILTDYPQWVDVDATKTSADPFVVAEAIHLSPTVVTHETMVGPDSKKAKIPNACGKYRVKCIHTKPTGSVYSDFFREMGWKF